MTDSPIRQAVKLISAYVGNNTVQVADLPDLIQRTYAALVATGLAAEIRQENQKPAVLVKRSITPDAIICLECGKFQSMMKRHIMTAHGLTVDDYRAKWSLPTDYPMVAPNYAARRSELAKKIGLGRKPKTTVKAEQQFEQAKDAPRHRYPASRWSKPTE